MSATPIPYLLQGYRKVARPCSDFQRSNSTASFRDAPLVGNCRPGDRPGIHIHDGGYGFRARSFHSRPGMTDGAGLLAYVRSALDVSRPGLLDQLDHRLRHRNVVEFLGHLAALGESPFEVLDGFGGGS